MRKATPERGPKVRKCNRCSCGALSGTIALPTKLRSRGLEPLRGADTPHRIPSPERLPVSPRPRPGLGEAWISPPNPPVAQGQIGLRDLCDETAETETGIEPVSPGVQTEAAYRSPTPSHSTPGQGRGRASGRSYIQQQRTQYLTHAWLISEIPARAGRLHARTVFSSLIDRSLPYAKDTAKEVQTGAGRGSSRSAWSMEVERQESSRQEAPQAGLAEKVLENKRLPAGRTGQTGSRSLGYPVRGLRWQNGLYASST